MPVSFLSVYFFAYVLLPRYLQKKRYAAFILGAFAAAVCNFIFGIFLSLLFFKLTDAHLTGTDKSTAPFKTSFYYSVLLTIFASCIVTGIKLTKEWHLQKMENLKLLRLKSEKEIELLKTQIQPLFLSQSLQVLHEKIVLEDADTSHMILQLAELLSNILYDNDKLIPLEKEFNTLNLFIDIENMNKSRSVIQKPDIKGISDGKYITPLILLSHLQQALTGAAKKIALSINIFIENDLLVFSLTGSTEFFTKIALYNAAAYSFDPAEKSLRNTIHISLINN